MISIAVATRRYNKETYIYRLDIPSYEGEKGCCGIELSPQLCVISPENDFGYEDYYRYYWYCKKGCWSERYHPRWITKKIREHCNKFFGKYEATFMFPGCYNERGLYDRNIFKQLGYEETRPNYYEKKK